MIKRQEKRKTTVYSQNISPEIDVGMWGLKSNMTNMLKKKR